MLVEPRHASTSYGILAFRVGEFEPRSQSAGAAARGECARYARYAR
jgi:hypothetical protein